MYQWNSMIRETTGKNVLPITKFKVFIMYTVCFRPLTLPNFLTSKKPVKSGKYGASKPPVRLPGYGSYSTGNGPSSAPVHEHDFTPSRGPSSSAGYSYGTNNNYDDYHDGPSYHHSSSTGPQSFVSMSSNFDEGEPEGMININHGSGYNSNDYQKYNYQPSSSKISSSYNSGRSSGHYDPLHPLRNYHSTGHDNEDMYTKLRQEYETKSRGTKSPYYHQYSNDYNEPSSTSVQSSLQNNAEKPPKKKAYWRMSYVQQND